MAVTNIEVRLKHQAQLFNEFDPSPMVERDLSDAVVAFIVNWAMDAGRGAAFRLTIHTSENTAATLSARTVGEAVRNYFAYLAEEERLRNARLLRDGRTDLGSGLVFLLVCTLAARAVSASISGALGAAFAEGLSILGWVANWRPIEIFLYDWRPARQRAAVFEELSKMEVVLSFSDRRASAHPLESSAQIG